MAAVRARIGAAGGDSGVEVLAVTKGFGPPAVVAAAGAGCRSIGENYAQELTTKAATAADAGVMVHFIGRLQSNKAEEAVALFDAIHSVDRASLVDALAKATARLGRKPDCFVHPPPPWANGKSARRYSQEPSRL